MINIMSVGVLSFCPLSLLHAPGLFVVMHRVQARFAQASVNADRPHLQVFRRGRLSRLH